jgi:hypothetical protein
MVPSTVADTNNYNLRNRLNISQPSYRLSTYQQSYFPSTIKIWNTLDLNLRQLPTLPSFKSKLQQKYFQPKTVPSYFSCWDRYLSVLHARLRNNMLIELNMLDVGCLPVNIDILLFGNDNLSVEINTFIFSCVQNT